jgi:hypothetical protein
MSKRERYEALVRARKAYDPTPLGLVNPAAVEAGRYDSDEVGPWTRWAGDLDADLMVVGQDWGGVPYFVANRGFDQPGNPTNDALAQLLARIGRPLPTLPTPNQNAEAQQRHRRCGVFLTNASLWLKSGGLSAPVKGTWFREAAAPFLLEQIAIVQPRVVVALGACAYRAILHAYEIPVPSGPHRNVVNAREGVPLDGTGCSTLLFGVYHCGAKIQRTLRPLVEQRRDWDRIAQALAD